MIPQAFPNIGEQIADPQTGIVSVVWRRFFVTLWDLTGAGGGGSSGGSVNTSGMVSMWAAHGVPAGWLLCDGAAVSRAQFSNLFAVIGTIWGVGDGVNTFNLPNMVNVGPLGAGDHVLGAHGGSNSFTLDVTQLPGHSHGVVDPGHTHTVTDPGHTHGVTDPGHKHTALVASSTNTAGAAAGTAVAGDTGTAVTGLTVNSATTGVTNASALTGVTTSNTGGGASVTILPPYAAINFIIKT